MRAMAPASDEGSAGPGSSHKTYADLTMSRVLDNAANYISSAYEVVHKLGWDWTLIWVAVQAIGILCAAAIALRQLADLRNESRRRNSFEIVKEWSNDDVTREYNHIYRFGNTDEMRNGCSTWYLEFTAAMADGQDQPDHRRFFRTLQNLILKTADLYSADLLDYSYFMRKCSIRIVVIAYAFEDIFTRLDEDRSGTFDDIYRMTAVAQRYLQKHLRGRIDAEFYTHKFAPISQKRSNPHSNALLQRPSERRHSGSDER
jgi:hypothetical protein